MNNLQVGELVVEELTRLGITQFVVSPGSRSTPLTLAIARHTSTNPLVHFDERGAAFFALGYARATGIPAVLVCTSGTAVANYFPAVIEASLDNIPLIVLTADRPPELINVGANQAIFQQGIYGVYPRLALNLPPVDMDTPGSFILKQIDQLYDAAMGNRPGPVHMNCQFREPLLDDRLEASQTNPSLDQWLNSQTRFTEHTEFSTSIPPEQFQNVAKEIDQRSLGLIIVGRSVTKGSNKMILKLAETLGWPILADVQSRLRFSEHPNIINQFDLGLLNGDLEGMLPEMVIHFGGAFTSKRLLDYLNEPDIYYVSVRETPENIDPNHQVKLILHIDINLFCDSLLTFPYENKSDWLKAWQDIHNQTRHIVLTALADDPLLSEPAICHELSKMIPDNHGLMLANSMPIREMEMFASIGHFKGDIFANRGASGIDGLLATAAGYGAGVDCPVTLLIGDLAFLHDLNSLQLIKTAKNPIIMVVINNDGGGIFSFLPVRNETDVFETFFATPHGLTLKHAASMFGLNYSNPVDMDEFLTSYRGAVDQSKSILIEVSTDRSENYRFHHQLFESLSESS